VTTQTLLRQIRYRNTSWIPPETSIPCKDGTPHHDTHKAAWKTHTSSHVEGVETDKASQAVLLVAPLEPSTPRGIPPLRVLSDDRSTFLLTRSKRLDRSQVNRASWERSFDTSSVFARYFVEQSDSDSHNRRRGHFQFHV
jgi:hypothetical protein